ncbi:unnamed protein product, partial [Amoebophrya sp. A120]
DTVSLHRHWQKMGTRTSSKTSSATISTSTSTLDQTISSVLGATTTSTDVPNAASESERTVVPLVVKALRAKLEQIQNEEGRQIVSVIDFESQVSKRDSILSLTQSYFSNFSAKGLTPNRPPEMSSSGATSNAAGG